MIANWMLYAVVLGLAVSVVAAAAEYALRLYGRSTRWLWATSLVTVLAVPVLALFLAPVPAAPALRPLDFAIEPVAQDFVPAPAPAAAPAPVPLAARLVALEARLDGALPRLWLLASVLAALGVALSYLRLRRQRSGWAEAEVDGMGVLVSEATGPAVVGLRRSRIVVPAWVLEEPEARRRMILAHEAEHIAAGDARLVTAALAALVAAPWNPAIWWQVRRLRLAAELDCDARVLRRGADLRGYAGLLLDVGMRFGDGAAVAAFAEPRSLLARRLRVLTAPLPRRRGWRVAAGVAAALVVSGAACMTPRPAKPVPPAKLSVMPASTPSVDVTPAGVRKPALLNGAELAVLIRAKYPPLAWNGRADVVGRVGADGSVVQSRVMHSAGRPELDTLALEVVRAMRFERPDLPPASELWLQMTVTLAPDAPPPTLPTAMLTGPGGPKFTSGERPLPFPVDTPPTAPLPVTPYDVAPELVNRPEVAAAMKRLYTRSMRDAPGDYPARLRLHVDEKGQVADALLETSSGRGDQDSATLAIARVMRFNPALRNGKPVAVWIEHSWAMGRNAALDGASIRVLPPTRDEILKGPSFTPYTVAPELKNRDEVRQALIKEYPPLLKAAGVGGTTQIWVLIDEQGGVVRSSVKKTSDRAELDSVAVRVGRMLRFTSGLNGDEPVMVWVALPIVFKTTPDAAAAAVPPAAPPIPGPGQPSPTPEEIRKGPTFTPYTVAPELTNRREIVQLLAREYPPEFKAAGQGDTVQIWLLVDEKGGVERVAVRKSHGTAPFDSAALRVGRAMRFTPGLNLDKPVMVWVALPIMFRPTPQGAERPAPQYDYSGLPRPDSKYGIPGLPEGLMPPSPGVTEELGRAYVDGYPRDVKVSGPAWVNVTVSAQGIANGFSLAKSSGNARVDSLAVDFARKLKWQPAFDPEHRAVTTTVAMPFPTPPPPAR